MEPYIGRYAPSPTGALHAGSLVAALASYLDAQAHDGMWLVRIEDVDTPRCSPAHAETILQQLTALGLYTNATAEAPVVYQSQRAQYYQAALDTLVAQGMAYPCSCSRSALATRLVAQHRPTPRGQEAIYDGLCRGGLHQVDAAQVAWRMRTKGAVEANTGDFVLRRADGLWAYQLAVVVDDALQGVTHIVRGMDILDNTPRQIYLQQCLGYATPQYLHTPLVLGENGEKLSKQNGARAIDTSTPQAALAALNAAAQVLGLSAQGASLENALLTWTDEWRALRARYITPF